MSSDNINNAVEPEADAVADESPKVEQQQQQVVTPRKGEVSSNDLVSSPQSTVTITSTSSNFVEGANVQCKFVSSGGGPAPLPDAKFAEVHTVGHIQAKAIRKMKVPMVFLLLQIGSDGFMPTPDMTLKTLSELFCPKEDVESGKASLTFVVSQSAETFA